MGNKVSSKKQEEESADKIYVMIQVNNTDGIISEKLKFNNKKISNQATFRYFDVSKTISDNINKGYSYTIFIYKGQTNTDTRLFVDDNYRNDREKYTNSINIIDKKTYYDYRINSNQSVILRHCNNCNLKYIIIHGSVF